MRISDWSSDVCSSDLILYRGILMPFSSDDETIDFVFGVINWKEAASQAVTAEIDREVEAALLSSPTAPPVAPIWADGPAVEDFDTLDLGGKIGRAHV